MADQSRREMISASAAASAFASSMKSISHSQRSLRRMPLARFSHADTRRLHHFDIRSMSLVTDSRVAREFNSIRSGSHCNPKTIHSVSIDNNLSMGSKVSVSPSPVVPPTSNPSEPPPAPPSLPPSPPPSTPKPTEIDPPVVKETPDAVPPSEGWCWTRESALDLLDAFRESQSFLLQCGDRSQAGAWPGSDASEFHGSTLV